MASGKLVLFLVVMVTILVATPTNGVSICDLQPKDLNACKPAVAKTNPTNPSPDCCAAIKALTPDDIKCLCDYKTNKPGMLEFLGVDPTQAMKLPGLCGSSAQVNC